MYRPNLRNFSLYFTGPWGKFTGYDCGARILIIHQHTFDGLVTIRVACRLGDVKVVLFRKVSCLKFQGAPRMTRLNRKYTYFHDLVRGWPILIKVCSNAILIIPTSPGIRGIGTISVSFVDRPRLQLGLG